MKTYAKIFLLGLLSIFVLALYGIILRPPPTPVSQPASTPTIETVSSPSLNLYKVIRVVDGDTIEIEGGNGAPSGVKVRLIGIDTPELNKTGVTGCFGRESYDYANKLLTGQTIRLEKDVSETDRYGRLLRFIYLDNTFINDKLVRDGYARVYTYPPDVKFQEQFKLSEKYARENNLGLWSNCKI